MAPIRQIASSRLILTAFVLVGLLMLPLVAVTFQAPELLGRDKVLTDFDAFHIAGTMALQGHAADAYQARLMLAMQQVTTGTGSFMPWTYPPPYTLMMQALAHLPIGTAYLLFVLPSALFYGAVLRRIAGPWLPGVLIAILPVVLLLLRTGQNGFLTGGLIGWFLLACIEPRKTAGVPLGVMIIKPHLAAGISLLALLERRWTAMAIAAAIVAAALAAATLAYGLAIWPAFLGSVREASVFLAAGFYPLHRMTSIYATAWSLGAPASLALAIHLAGAIAALVLLVLAWWSKAPPRILAAATCAASLLVSPYNYDYDLTILGLAIAFAFPALLEKARPAECAGLLVLAWFATGYGLIAQLGKELTSGTASDLEPAKELALAAPALIVLLIWASLILRRPAHPAPGET